MCIGMIIGAVGILGIRTKRENMVTFLNVGQGDCILIQTASGENYLFDCGSTGKSQVGKNVLLPCLKYYGIHSLDGVFVSHPDADHASGILELLEIGAENAITVEQLILPGIEQKAAKEQFAELLQAAQECEQPREIRIGYISRGDSWQCESAKFYCLHPEEHDAGTDSNAYSQCIYVEFKEDKSDQWTLLLTGDVEQNGEEQLALALRSCGISDVTLLKVAHHGSKNASSEEILEILRPSVSIISCGENNSYGHPHAETLERLKTVKSVVLSTPQYGAITVKMGQEIEVRGWKRE